MGCGGSTDVSSKGPVALAKRQRQKRPPLEDVDDPEYLGYSRHRVNSAVSFYERTARSGSAVDPNEVKLTVEAAHNVSQIHRGNPEVQRLSDVKIVRIFTSSTFTDTKEERNALMERIYPNLKVFCQKLGYEFQVVDMRWGVRSEAQDNHMTTEHCLKELKACQTLSTGPNFVTFLSHKYGYRPFPRIIEAKEFETITADVNSEEKEIIDIWFRKDENATPPHYVLQPISVIYPEFNSPDPSVNREASNKWWSVFELLQQLLKDGAKKNLKDEATILKYAMSVTENEIHHGILEASEPNKHCLWFKRTLLGVEDADAEGNLEVGKYYDGADAEARELQAKLRDEKIPQHLSDDNTIEYPIEWTDDGVNPINPSHEAYINQLCDDFESRLKAMIDEGIKERQAQEVADPLYNEIVQHINFSQAKCTQFHGRKEVLERLKTYVRGTSNQPLVLVGMSGSGKTSLLAQASQDGWEWLGNKGAIIYRFIGTTQASSTLRPLLGSLNNQILKVYLQKAQPPRQDLKYLVEDLKDLLSMASQERPLLILLDSLDQLDNMDGGRHLHWLPRQLPPHCKMILSTLPQAHYGCFPRLKGLYPAESCYMDVPVMSQDDVVGISNKWLDLAKRSLTKAQKEYIMSCYRSCPLPLYLRLSFDEALRWHSYDPPEATRLQATIIDTINALLARIENVHGVALVSHALGCITASQGGLSETEIEDVLSLSDEVLNDVYQFWTPPARRLPPLLWVRVRNDLEQYLVNRGVDGVQVIYWYHRQFIETAVTRYLEVEGNSDKFHLALAEFFLGIWADRPKPYVGQDGQQRTAARFVAKQPLQFEAGEYNMRKLMQLPFHLISAGELGAVKSQALCNFAFLQTKLEAVSFRAVLQDLKDACVMFSGDPELHIVRETLQLARDGLNADPRELAGQLAARIHGTGSGPMLEQARGMLEAGTLPADAAHILTLLEAFEEKYRKKNKHLTELLAGSQKPTSPSLIPHRGFLVPPGGQLLHKLAEHTDVVVDVEITNDGRLAATGSYDNTAKVWDIKSGEMLQSVDFPENVGDVRFCNEDQWLAVSCWRKQLYVIHADIGTIIHQKVAPKGPDLDQRHRSTESLGPCLYRDYLNIDGQDLCMPIVKCTVRNMEFIVSMRNTSADVWDIRNGKRLKTLSLDIDDWSVHHLGAHITRRHLVGCGQYFLYAGYKDNGYFVRSIADDQFSKHVPLFEKYAYTRESKMADFAPRRQNHVSTLALTPDGTVVLVGNGANKDIMLIVFDNGQVIKTLKGQGSARMSSFYFPPGCEWFYYAHDNLVGHINIRENSTKLMLPHPCKVRKVVGIDSNIVITIGEDSILRIWDKSMQPFQQDMSMITGKVTVYSEEAADHARETFKNMMSDILGEDMANVTDLLTTTETENYWTREVVDAEDDRTTGNRVAVEFFLLHDARYAVAAHSDVISGYAICLTVWELAHMGCVRRMFLPPECVMVHCVINETHVVISEKETIKLLDMESWEISTVFEEPLPKRSNPTVVHVTATNELLVESKDASYLQFLSVKTQDVTGHLVPTSQGLERHLSSNQGKKANQIVSVKVNEKQTTVAALYTSGDLHFWNIRDNTRAYLCCLQPSKFLKATKNKSDFCYGYELSRDGNYVILTRDMPQVMWESLDEQRQSCVVVKLETGKALGHPVVLTVAQRMVVRVRVLAPVIRKFRHKELQMIGLDDRDQAVIIDQTEAGVHAQHVRMTPNARHLVTWCPEPREKTLRCWSFLDNELSFLASLTPDQEVADIALVDGINTLLIDSPSGVVTLHLKGTEEDSPKAEKPKAKRDDVFPGVDLNIPFPT